VAPFLRFLGAVAVLGIGVQEVRTRDVRWGDLPAVVQQGLERAGVGGAALFDAWRDRVRATNVGRLRDGDFDHLVHYALQSTRLTSRPPIEPALSAKAFIESFPAEARARVLKDGGMAGEAVESRVPADARVRLEAMAKALAPPASSDARMIHFREIVTADSGGNAGGLLDARQVAARLTREYVRAMRFLYEKEFVATQAADSPAAVASLYQSRGHSSDTEVEAGYAVYVALATLKQLEPQRRIARVLIIGPGLDLAPRTGLLEHADPQSYQPFAVADALLELGLAERGALRIDAMDLNPHVARTIQRAVRAPGLRLFLTTGIPNDARTRLTEDYRAYFTSLGGAIAREREPAAVTRTADDHLHKVVTVASDVQTTIAASRLDMVTERIDDASYDLVVVTNVFPYLTDAELMVAVANITASLKPGGLLIHNETRPLILSAATAIGLPVMHARTVMIAKVPGGRDLYDNIWMHRKKAP
jgi:hypothetical protein